MILVAIHAIEWHPPSGDDDGWTIAPGETFSATAFSLSDDEVGRLGIEGHARLAPGS